MLYKILRNIFSLLLGQAASKLFVLGCVIILARKLGVNGFGVYGTVMAYLTLFAAFADSGATTVTIREVAKDTSRSAFYFSHVLVLRLLLTLVAYGLMLLLGTLWQAQDYTPLFIATCGLFLFPEALRKLAESLLSAHERMDLIALLNILSSVFRYAPFLAAIVLGKSVYAAFLLLIAAWTCVAGIWLLVTKKFCLRQWFVPIHLRTVRDILYEAFPFGVFFVLSIVYFKADIIMLSKMKNSASVGFYEAAYKFIDAAMFIPVSIVNVLLPIMSRSFATDKTSYSTIYTHSTRLLAMGILPVVIGMSFFARDIILLVYGEAYLPAAPALSLLIWALFLIFINAPVGNILATSNLMHAFLPYAIANTLLNIILNFFLIPHYNFLGASFTTVLTEFTAFLLQLYFAHRVLHNMGQTLRMIGKILAAGGIASLVLYAAKTSVFFPVNLLIMLGVYIGSLFAFKLISSEDRRLCKELYHAVTVKLL